RPQPVLALRLGLATIDAPARGAVRPCPQLGEDRLHVEARVPDVEVAHARELGHGGAVLAHGRGHDPPADLGSESPVAPGDLEARSQALDVPLPRAGEGLVEVV